MEKFIQEVLDKLSSLEQGQQVLEQKIIKRFDNIGTDLSALNKGQEKMTRQLDVITNSVDTLSTYVKKHDEKLTIAK